MKWGHDELAADLARHLRGVSDRVVWTDMQLGSSGSPRPDVYTVPKSFAKFRPIAYEVKISVADFRRDVTSGKWQSYLKFASGVIFAVPGGLVRKEDVPPGCGLIVRNETGWHNLKGPTLAKMDGLPQEVWLKLLIDGIDRQVTRVDNSPRQLDEYRLEDALRKRYGEHIARAFHDMAGAQVWFEAETRKLQRTTEQLREEERERVAHARRHVEEELRLLRSSQTDLAKALGLQGDADVYAISRAANKLRQRLVGDGENERLREKLRRARQELDAGLEELPLVVVPAAAGELL